MNYFSPGLRELARKLRRQTIRLRIFWRKRDLAKAETQLGLLGWQQADYDEETQRQVNAIQQVEREQARLTNEAAALANEIRQLQGDRETARKEYEEKCRGIEAERKQISAPHAQIERQLAEKRKVEPNFEKRIPELDRELREVQRRYTDLLASPKETLQIKQELIHLRERSVAIPNEKSDLRTQHLRTVSEIRALEMALQKEALALAELDERSDRLDEEWQARDRELVQKVRAKERDKTRLEKEIDTLETAKVNPYQRIGQVLADSNISPMNQPEALSRVKALRLQVGELHQAILESEALSAQDDQKLIRSSFWLWGGMAAGVLLVLIAAFS